MSQRSANAQGQMGTRIPCDWPEGCGRYATMKVVGRKGEYIGNYCDRHGKAMAARLNEMRKRGGK